MAYVKNNWVDREGTTRYFETVDDDGALILTPDYTKVTEMGTPVNADNMNHIEEGIEAGSFTKYDSTSTYALNDLVTTFEKDELKVYKSLVENNAGSLKDKSFWEEVEFSNKDGGSLPIGQIYSLSCSPHYVPEGSLPTDGAEYSKSQFPELWDNYLTSDELEAYEEPWSKPTSFIIDNKDITTLGISLGGIAYGNGKFVAYTGSSVTTSTDGIHWETPTEVGANNWGGIKYVNGLFILWCNNLGNCYVTTSTDGIHWSARGTIVGGSSTTYCSDVTYGNGKFVAVGHFTSGSVYGWIKTSNDGITWANEVRTENMQHRSVVYGNDKFVVRSNTAALISTDGINWETTQINRGSDKILYVNNKFMLISNGLTVTSVDGVVWEEQLTTSFDVGTTSAICYDRNKFVMILGDANYNKYVTTSNDAIEWETPILLQANSGSSVSSIVYGNGRFIVSSLTNVIYKIDTDKMKSLLNTCSYNNYSQDLATYGQCGKFAVDVDNEVFRVPHIKDGAVIQQALSDSELGKSYNAGLPNITGGKTTDTVREAVQANGALTFNITSKYSYEGYKSSGNGAIGDVYFDASLSNAIYGNSDTVQPNAIALRYFVVVADGSINESKMDWSAWASSLQGKANKTDVDGQWESKVATLCTEKAIGQYQLNVLEYLPNDDYQYEIMFTGMAQQSGATYSRGFLYTTPIGYCYLFNTGTANRGDAFTVSTVVGSDRLLKFEILGYALETWQGDFINELPAGLNAIAYRRLGKNQ